MGPEIGRGTISRDEIIGRAQSWLRPSVRYHQDSLHSNEHGTYRRDCSGYVSMAWGLPGAPPDLRGGLDILELASVGFDIIKTELLPGDALLRTDGTRDTRHVVIFERWADDERRGYWGFEQSRQYGTVHRVVHYPYEERASKYRPFRYLRCD